LLIFIPMSDLVGFVASRLDNTLLKLGVDRDSLQSFVDKSIYYKVRAVVVHPYFIRDVAEWVGGASKVVSVVAFPYGYTSPEVKIREAEFCINSGADELDIVMNVYLLRAGDLSRFREEAYLIKKRVAEEYSVPIKFIVEITVLNKRELDAAIDIVNEVGPDFFKTSTGHGPRGTTVEDVRYIRSKLSSGIKLKASGGIRSLKQFLDIVAAGADVVGASRGIDIIEEALGKKE